MLKVLKRMFTAPVLGSPVIVLGMHRSGTSFLTGSLQLAGLDLGQHSTQDRHNSKGNRENLGIVTFHNAVLEARGFAWDRPPPSRIDWTAAERAQAAALITGYDHSRIWGFKDPRSLLMVEEWQALCPQARFIGIFRNPVAVVRSLTARGKISEAAAYDLWAAYNARLLALHDRLGFALLNFDAAEPVLHARMNRIFPKMGLKPLSADRFFSADLKHHAAEAALVPEAVRPMFARLEARQW